MPSARIDGARALAAPSGTTLVAIGNFDGVHTGHQAVIRDAVARARSLGLEPVVLTFHPHPAAVLGKGQPALLTSIEHRVELLAAIDPALRVVVEPFTRELAALEPERFVRELLLDALGAKLVLVGDNFRFGRDRSGDVEVLRRLGAELGFEVWPEPLAGDADGTYSSTRIRQAVAAGDLAMAEHILGRAHSLSGLVVEGDRRGRTLGFPTANLGGIAELLPARGVYAGRVERLGPTGPTLLADAVLNVGVRPTVDAGATVPSVEIHLLDFSGDLYGERLRVQLLARIREELRFSGLDELKAQIARDVAEGRRLLAARDADRVDGAHQG